MRALSPFFTRMRVKGYARLVPAPTRFSGIRYMPIQADLRAAAKPPPRRAGCRCSARPLPAAAQLLDSKFRTRRTGSATIFARRPRPAHNPLVLFAGQGAGAPTCKLPAAGLHELQRGAKQLEVLLVVRRVLAVDLQPLAGGCRPQAAGGKRSDVAAGELQVGHGGGRQPQRDALVADAGEHA